MFVDFSYPTAKARLVAGKQVFRLFSYILENNIRITENFLNYAFEFFGNRAVDEISSEMCFFPLDIPARFCRLK